ncbi:mRNA decay activator protein ZFP36L2-B-like [Pleurodeles waltl]|uniref:mRNA decay activator protein ZFP36L2-B-like n=1 Tax=Pleurodeles waltl TaxID=8319 RepID=UPI003709A168
MSSTQPEDPVVGEDENEDMAPPKKEKSTVGFYGPRCHFIHNAEERRQAWGSRELLCLQHSLSFSGFPQRGAGRPLLWRLFESPVFDAPPSTLDFLSYRESYLRGSLRGSGSLSGSESSGLDSGHGLSICDTPGGA